MATNKKGKKGKKKTVRPTGRLKEFMMSTQFRRLVGALDVLFAVFLAVAMLSFFVKWPSHDNWVGSLGFGCARFFVQNLFGIASLGFSFLFFIQGLRRWDVKLLPWQRTLWSTLFWMAWLSSVLGYCSGAWGHGSDVADNFSGVCGRFIAAKLYDLIKWGAMVFFLFIAIVVLVFVHKVRFSMPKVEMPNLNLKGRIKDIMPSQDDDSDDDDDDEQEKKPSRLAALFPKREKEAPKPQEETAPAETTEAPAEQPQMSIDDVFARINQRAQGKPAEEVEAPAPVQSRTEDIPFSIQVTEPDPEPAPQEEEDPVYSEFEKMGTGDTGSIDTLYDPHLDLKLYQMPDTDILIDYETKNTKVTKEELIANKDHIVETLRNYGIEIMEISASPGPTVTLYEIKPAPGVRISKIKGLEDDIALSLSALGIRIIAPIPGKGTVGIEVPNTQPQIVSMKNMLECDAFQNAKMELPIAFGKTISNEPFVTDLAKMPHLLMAGATGTGKSVGLNAVIASLLYKKHPSELKFVMVDPKKVELSLYNKIERHYLAKLPDSDEPIITDTKKVVRTLNSLCIEMDQRYDLLRQAGVRKITEYNDKFIHRHLNPENGHRYMPYIVLVIDEFADLIMTAGKEVEMPICRLAQLARAVGIHLIIATQRPTTNIITGTIKANFPARVAFKVTSGIDSRTILDCSGAQRLIGRGDMLISLSGSDLVRIQCALIDTKEIEELADCIGSQRGYPDGFLLPEYLDENEEPNKDFDPKQKDEFFNDAARLVVASQFGSTSLLQRKLQLGYNRAGRIIDQLEAAGIVGPYNGSKAREVLVHDETQLEEILRSL